MEDSAERHAVVCKSVLNEFWLSAHEANAASKEYEKGEKQERRRIKRRDELDEGNGGNEGNKRNNNQTRVMTAATRGMTTCESLRRSNVRSS